MISQQFSRIFILNGNAVI